MLGFTQENFVFFHVFSCFWDRPMQIRAFWTFFFAFFEQKSSKNVKKSRFLACFRVFSCFWAIFGSFFHVFFSHFFVFFHYFHFILFTLAQYASFASSTLLYKIYFTYYTVATDCFVAHFWTPLPETPALGPWQVPRILWFIYYDILYTVFYALLVCYMKFSIERSYCYLLLDPARDSTLGPLGRGSQKTRF